ncbi:MAG: glycosyltransferase family 4 protein [Candidatus Competibacter sp.]|nr:glycosyltransferase family 4 protein [Candidatus Competibacter sp.]
MNPLSGLRIVHATTGHPAHDDRIFFKEARSLVRSGADVTLLCSDTTTPPANLYGVRYQTYPGGGALKRRLITRRPLESALAEGRYDVIHCHEPDGLLAALRVKRKTGVKVIFDSHEMWGATLAHRFPPWSWNMVSRGYQWLESRWIAQCDRAIGASWAISDYLASILGPERVTTILNVPVTDVFAPPVAKSWEDPITFCHDGHLGFDRGLKTMAEAIRQVSEKYPVRFKIVGDVFGEERNWLTAFIDKYRLQDVITRTGWLPYEQVGAALAPCHIGLIALLQLPNNVVTSSNKVFNYMLYGMPFIGPSFRLAKQKLVAEEHCGLLADSADPASYAAAMRSMIENKRETQAMAERALNASRTKYRWEHMEPLLVDLYARM